MTSAENASGPKKNSFFFKINKPPSDFLVPVYKKAKKITQSNAEPHIQNI
jgi:hypothetical protein